MVIQNRLESAKYRVIYFAMFAATLISFGYYFFYEMPLDKITGLISGGIIGCIYVFLFLKEYNYLWFSDSGNKFIFRFYFSHPFLQKPKAMEIPKSILTGYSIRESLFGLKHSLVLELTTKSGTANYKPICLSGWSKKNRKDMEEILKQQIVLNRVDAKKSNNKALY